MNPGFSEFLRAAPRDRRDVFLGAATRLGTPEQNVEKDFWGSGDVGALALVAVQACKSQILNNGFPAVLPSTMWSTWKEPTYADAGIWQYSHRRFARSQTLRISS
jgi:hypothetical protein